MELRTLRYFLTVASEGNITRAAELLHITQPSLSRQMMDLEREIGSTLILRSKKGITLTDDGMFFRQRAEEIVELADRLEQRFAEKSDSVTGLIALGATEAMGGRTFAKLICQFAQKYPLVQFSLYNEMADNIKDRLDQGLIDIGLLLEPVDVHKYEYIRLPSKETWGLLVREDHPLADPHPGSAGGDSPLAPDPPAAGTRPAGYSQLAGRRGKRPSHPVELHPSLQRGPSGGRGPGCRVLSGRCSGRPQRSPPPFYTPLPRKNQPERPGLEKEPALFSRHFPLCAGNQYDAHPNELLNLCFCGRPYGACLFLRSSMPVLHGSRLKAGIRHLKPLIL